MPSYRAEYVPPAPVPDNSLVYFGANPSWTPEREGRVRWKEWDKAPEDCPLCGGAFLLDCGDVYFVDGKAYRAKEPLAIRPAVIGEPGYFFLADGTVMRPADKTDPLMDSELVVVACARCGRVPERYRLRLKGTKGTGDMKRLSHRAARIIGKPEASLNPYISAAEKLEAAKAKQKKSKGATKGKRSKAARKTASPDPKNP
jgi:hypothetical protein